MPDHTGSQSPQQDHESLRELQELRQQQTATADVLKAISRAPVDLQSVLDSLVRTAAVLCKADMSGLTRPMDEGHRHIANYGCGADFFEHLKTLYMTPGRQSIVGRVLQEGKTHQIADVIADPDYKQIEAQKLGGYRTLLGVPLLREGRVIGVLVLYRREVRPFSQRQIELLNTFADQAVIAIENARLFDELDLRTRELRSALEEQTATAEILRVISCSRADIQPVFETIARQAVRLCGSIFANVFLYDGTQLQYVASCATNHGYVELLERKYPMRPDGSQVSGRVILTGGTIKLEDAHADCEYDQRFPDALGWRRMLGVPLIHNGATVGTIVVGWRDPGPVPMAQEALLNTFADQAVIAIEHVRLVRELEQRNIELSEALQQQTATSEVLKAISRSTFDLQTILDTLTRSAAVLCDAEMAAIARRDDNRFYYASNYKFPDVWLEYVQSIRPRADHGTVAGRVLMSGKPVQIPDILVDSEYAHHAAQPKAGFRTLLGVPLLRAGKSIGAVILGRKTVAPFTDKQVEIISTFADQAVLAIENVRLFDEVQKKSEELALANCFKSRFLSAASHDLRQPLHALNLFAAQLRNETDETERARLVTRISEALGAMNELFEALLDMSKLEAGVVEPKVTDFPVERVLKRLESTFVVATRSKGLRMSAVPGKVHVRSDFILLERMLLNLVSNAVRYTQTGGVLIGARRRGSSIRIDVVDTGAGIPPSEQAKVFGEFYQLEPGKAMRREGLGLGLSIVDRLGQLLGHHIELDSRVGRGSRFSVYVPRVDDSGTAKVAPPVQAVVANRIAGRLLVVIDDDRLVLESMHGLLKRWGCDVIAVGSATDALSELTRLAQQPDAIISDFRLAEGHSGIEAIRSLRQHCQSQVPAFLMSGDTEPGLLREASESGLHLLHKPILPMTLRAMLSRLLLQPPTANEPNGMEDAISPHRTSR